MFSFGSFCVVIALLALGDLASAKTKGVLPSVFVISLLFLVGYWSGLLPADIVTRVGLGAPLAYFAMSIMVVQMGSMISLQRLASEWRSVVIAATGLAGMVAFLLIFGKMIIDWETVVVATPPLTGGVVAAQMIAQAAVERGFSNLAGLATLIYIFQGFVGYPLTAWCLRLEGRRLLDMRQTDPQMLCALPDEMDKPDKNAAEIRPFFATLQRTTSFTRIALISLVALAADLVSIAMREFLAYFAPSLVIYTLPPLVLCFLFGCLATKYRVTDRRALARTSSVGFLVIIVTAHIMEFLSGATPEMVLSSLSALVVTIGVGTAGLVCFSAAASKFFDASIPMAVALSLTALFGFPPNFLLADEAARHLSTNADEYHFLMQRTLPQMLVGGFVTVMIASVLIAELFVKILG
ncbi:MAG: hypothetical protein LBQ42_14070 [Synergistaceae bacterium]|jgi:hypothetical protein|nr:hypothetical protein [Synergistaceae bacterium]